MPQYPTYSLSGGNQYPAVSTAVPAQYPTIAIVDAQGNLVQNLGNGPADGEWVTMTALLNGATAVEGHTPQYMKDSRGGVHMRGRILVGTTEVSFALPAGYRPIANHYFNWVGGASTNPSTAATIVGNNLQVGYNAGGVYAAGVVTDLASIKYLAVS